MRTFIELWRASEFVNSANSVEISDEMKAAAKKLQVGGE